MAVTQHSFPQLSITVAEADLILPAALRPLVYPSYDEDDPQKLEIGDVKTITFTSVLDLSREDIVEALRQLNGIMLRGGITLTVIDTEDSSVDSVDSVSEAVSVALDNLLAGSGES